MPLKKHGLVFGFQFDRRVGFVRVALNDSKSSLSLSDDNALAAVVQVIAKKKNGRKIDSRGFMFLCLCCLANEIYGLGF